MNILELLLERGFAFRTFPAYPRHLGVEKYHCAALLELTPQGALKLFSSAGYLLDSGEIALLVERRDGAVFVHKSKELAADNGMLQQYRRFVSELQSALDQQAVESSGSET